MKLTLKIWRQKDTTTAGRFVSYQVDGVTPEMSFLEMLDVLNEALIERGGDGNSSSRRSGREGPPRSREVPKSKGSKWVPRHRIERTPK